MENINNFTNQLNEICQFGNSFNLSNKYVGLLSTEFKTSGDTLENIIDNIAHTYARTRKINIDLDSKLNLENLFNIIENGVKLTLYTKFGLNYRDIINKFDYINELTTAAKEELIVCINEGYKRIFTKMERVIINEVEKAPKVKRNYTKAEIAEARSINLVDYLLSKGENIKRVGSKGEYTLQDHDSMRINENKFVWNSQGINGNAVDFCMRYYNMTFTEAVGDLLSFNGHIKIDEYVTPNAQKTVATNNQAKLLEPEPIINPIPYDLDAKTNRAYSYLTKTRLIDEEIVQKLIAEERIAQDIKGNLIFKIYDKDNHLSGAEITGTLTDKRYKQVTERNGNGFVLNLNASDKPTTAMFFESAIDLLSFYSLHKNTTALLVSMAGIKDKVIEKTVK